MPEPNPTSERRRPRLTLGRKLGALFVFVALCSLALAALIVLELERVRLDAHDFLEETHEARHAHELMSTVEKLELATRLPVTSVPDDTRDRLVALMSEKYRVLVGDQPAGEAEPSAHDTREEHLLHELANAIAAYARVEQGQAADDATQAERAWQMEELASELRDETSREAARAAEDLERRVQRLLGVMAATALASIGVLVVTYLLVRHSVVRPVAELRRGTELFGRGRLDHRILVGSRDEIGELAAEFNRMAERLDETHRDLERRVVERTEQFIRAARLADLGTFAAGVAHEVNTPLASIASCAEGLERRLRSGGVTTDEQVEYLQTIAREAYRAHDITARLLAFARDESGPTSLVTVAEPVRHAAGLLAHQAGRRRLDLQVDLHDGLPLVHGNSGEIEQVAVNLLKNAIDASPDGGRIRVSCRAAGDAVVIEVEDQGPGVPAALRDRIFDPFFTTKEPGRGTGLGLSLVHRIVESHGGRVEVGDAPAGGARFRVVLPAAPAAEGAGAS